MVVAVVHCCTMISRKLLLLANKRFSTQFARKLMPLKSLGLKWNINGNKNKEMGFTLRFFTINWTASTFIMVPLEISLFMVHYKITKNSSFYALVCCRRRLAIVHNLMAQSTLANMLKMFFHLYWHSTVWCFCLFFFVAYFCCRRRRRHERVYQNGIMKSERCELPWLSLCHCVRKTCVKIRNLNLFMERNGY